MYLDVATLFRLMFLADITASLLLLAYRDGSGPIAVIRQFVAARLMHGMACLLISCGPILPEIISLHTATALAYFAFALEGMTIARLRGVGMSASAIPFSIAAIGAVAHATGLSPSASVGTAGVVCSLLFGYTSFALIFKPNRTPLVWMMSTIMAANCLGAAARIYAGYVAGMTLGDTGILQTGGLLTAYLFCVGGGVGFLLLLKEESDRALRRAARCDPLTGVLNHRAFLEAVRHNLSLSRSRQSPISLLMIDLDHFKSVNDNYGHQVGDEVLRAASASVAAVLAERGLKDTLGRIGGEEFAVIVPFDAGNSQEIAEGMRRAIQAMRFSAVSGLSCTASIGIAEALTTDTLESLMKRSDLALYEAKRHGRDCVISFNVASTLVIRETEIAKDRGSACIVGSREPIGDIAHVCSVVAFPKS